MSRHLITLLLSTLMLAACGSDLSSISTAGTSVATAAAIHCQVGYVRQGNRCLKNTTPTPTPTPTPTQTCWDGSIILASSTCPAQPLPPPPAVQCSDGSTVPAGQTCPAPPPPPAPAPPSYSSGETPIADNFDTATGLQIGPIYTHPPSTEEVGAFRVLCVAGQLLKDDPIRFPGQPGASHLHQFWGNTGANSGSTYSSLRTTGDSTCDIGSVPINRTAYWMPAMLDGAGNAVKPDFINTYYKQVPAGSALCIARATACVGLPHGIKAIFGYNMTTGQNGPMDANSADYWAFKFECWTTPTSGVAAVNPPDGQHFTNIADVAKAGCPAGAGLIIYFAVPGCWDGVHLDSADHRSHLSYGTPETGNQVCPADHPFLITPWQGHVHYTTDANFVAGKWHLSSDEMVPGFVVGPASPVKAGMSLHFDYFEAWSPAVQAIWQQHCIDGHLTCSGGDTGNGQQIKGADGAVLPPPHQVVPLP